MASIRNAYYRSFQAVFNIGARFLVWRKPIVRDGAGAIREIHGLLAERGAKKPLLVTGPHIRQTLVPRILAILDGAGVPYAVFSDVEANPSVATCEKIREAFLREGCDGFIAEPDGSFRPSSRRRRMSRAIWWLWRLRSAFGVRLTCRSPWLGEERRK